MKNSYNNFVNINLIYNFAIRTASRGPVKGFAGGFVEIREKRLLGALS